MSEHPTAEALAALARADAIPELDPALAQAMVARALREPLVASSDGVDPALPEATEPPARRALEREGQARSRSLPTGLGALDARALDAGAPREADVARAAEIERDPGVPSLPMRARWPWAFAVAAAAAAALGLAWISVPAPAPTARPTRLPLPSGDVVTVSPGATFAIERLDVERRFRLERGVTLFEVRPLGPSESFEVITPHLRATVVGTVFTVEARADTSVVRVYEGRVRVAHDGERRELAAGEELVVGARAPGDALEGSPALVEDRRAIAALATRAERARRTRGSPVDERLVAQRSPRARAAEDAWASTPPASREGRGVSVSAAPATSAPTIGAPSREAPSSSSPRAGVVARGASPSSARDAASSGSSSSGSSPSAAASTSSSASRGAVGAATGESSPRVVAPGPDGPSSADELVEARRWIASGAAERALERARRRAGAAWRVVEGDALRALGRAREAVAAYERAAADDAHRTRAGYLVARTRAEQLADPEGALRALEACGCTEPSAPLAERALVMQARLLVRLGRRAAAAEVAERYLSAFPTGPQRAVMESLR